MQAFTTYVLPFLIFAAGIILVVKGGDIFVDAASWIAKAAGIPTFIIGATIVSIATTMPEMIVSCLAAAEGKNEMAVGNAVGSVIANTGLIMALAFMFMTVVIKRKAYLLPASMLLAATAILTLGSFGGSLSTWASILLIIIFILFMAQNVISTKRQQLVIAQSEVQEARVKPQKSETALNIGKFLLGATGIVVGSQFLVNGGSSIAALLHVPERIVAVTLVAVGTSLPELVTTLTAIKKKESNLSIGNIIGANIIDLTLILPVCSLVSGQALPVQRMSAMIDMPACLLIISIALIPLLVRQKASRPQGIIMLVAYAAYLGLTMFLI